MLAYDAANKFQNIFRVRVVRCNGSISKYFSSSMRGSEQRRDFKIFSSAPSWCGELTHFQNIFKACGSLPAAADCGQDGSAIFLQLENILKRATEPQEPYAVRAGAGLWVDRRLRVTQSSTAHSANG
jgi:hypothetical protein